VELRRVVGGLEDLRPRIDGEILETRLAAKQKEQKKSWENDRRERGCEGTIQGLHG